METDHTTLGLVITVATVVGNGLVAIVKELFGFLLSYRKTADAGQLAIVQAQHGQELERVRDELTTITVKATAAQAHAEKCDEQHHECLKGSAALKGQVDLLKEMVAKDIRETGAVSARLDSVERTKGNGGGTQA